MSIKIALAGNPNCGKTTIFNDLTGSSQYVGNWPGVTVEKKEGKLKGHKDVIVVDLPGIYSLSPYTLEEVVTRDYIINEKPDVVLNLVDGSNIERNLYLTTQLLEMGTPVVIALNMMDLVRKRGDRIDTKALGAALGCEIVETSALKGEGTMEAAQAAIKLATSASAQSIVHEFDAGVEGALKNIEAKLAGKVEENQKRWFAIKVFERDEKIMDKLALTKAEAEALEAVIVKAEADFSDDSESIITNERYDYIGRLISKAVADRKSVV